MKDWKFALHKKKGAFGRIRDAQNQIIADEIHAVDATLILTAIKLLDEALSDLRQGAFPDDEWVVKAEKTLRGESE